MSKDNLIISKDAAKTIGLNEAVLLEILNFNYKATKTLHCGIGEVGEKAIVLSKWKPFAQSNNTC